MSMDVAALRGLLEDEADAAGLRPPDVETLLRLVRRRSRRRAQLGAGLGVALGGGVAAVIAAVVVVSASGSGEATVIPAAPLGPEPAATSMLVDPIGHLPDGVTVSNFRTMPQIGNARLTNTFVGFKIAGQANAATSSSPAVGVTLTIVPLAGKTPTYVELPGFPAELVSLGAVTAKVTHRSGSRDITRIDWMQGGKLYQLIAGGRALTPHGMSGLDAARMLGLARYASSAY